MRQDSPATPSQRQPVQRDMLRASLVVAVVLAALLLCAPMQAGGQTTSQTTVACTANGRFSATGTACSQDYVACFQQPDGTFAQWEYTCPGATIFNPISQKCSRTVAGC